jgi:hypothetical protein
MNICGSIPNNCIALPPLPGTSPSVQTLSCDKFDFCGADGEGYGEGKMVRRCEGVKENYEL